MVLYVIKRENLHGVNLYGGYFYCLDSNGVILWKTIFPNEYDSCPAIAPDGTMYIGLQLGDFNFHQTQTLFAIKDSVTDIKDEKVETVKDYQLYQNYPNPFNPSTTISFQLPKSGYLTLKVYDILGKEVACLVKENRLKGKYDVKFDASKLSSGVYVYQLRTNDILISKKMLLTK